MYTPEQYVKDNLPHAKKVEKETGLHYLISLTQGALESDWGKKAIGNNFFGIKAYKNTPLEDKQLLTTTEILRTKKAKFPAIISITAIGGGQYKYKVKDWFMKYKSPAECFDAHYRFFEENPRYARALQFKNNPNRFFEEIALAKYATAPDYATTLKQVMNSVKTRLPK